MMSYERLPVLRTMKNHNVIRFIVSETMSNKDKLQRIMIDKDNNYETGTHVCFSSFRDTSQYAFEKALELIQRIVNRKLCKRDKNVSTETRVQFYHFFQYETHRHSHCLLKIPSIYNKKSVFDLIIKTATKMKEINKCYIKKVYKNDIANVVYTSSQLTLGRSDDDKTYKFI